MMKLSHIVILTVVAFALVFTGCDSTGAGGGGGGGNDKEDGTVTVTLSEATDLDGDLFAAFLYAHNEHSLHTADQLLAVNKGTIDGTTGNVDLVLKEDDGNFEPTVTNFVGTAGARSGRCIGVRGKADCERSCRWYRVTGAI